jgi:two-component system, chemotaxis family, protein-glutamate methylesterase/glutaminase
VEPLAKVVVIGASTGGVSALLGICEALPRYFGAAVCVVQHIGNHPSVLPELLRYRGPNPAMHAQEGQQLEPGTVYVAPPDHHMLLDGTTMRLSRGPKENHARPAIDPLFRSAAYTFGAGAIGVVLTGQMDDGTAGLKAIKACGGVAVVQDPATAEVASMPLSALRNVDVDHCVPLDAVAPLLQRLVADGRSHGAVAAPQAVAREVAINRGDIDLENLSAIVEPSPLTCPDCGGGLWEVKDTRPLRYRCNTGHAFSVLSLGAAQEEQAEYAMRSSVRALREREMLLRRFANLAAAAGDEAQRAAGVAQADRLRKEVDQLVAMAEAMSPRSVMDPQA